MMKKHILRLVVAFTLLAFVKTPIAFAQLDGLLGGTKIETIETADLNKLIQRQKEAEEKSKQAGEEPPKPDFIVVDVRSDAEVKVSVIPSAITKAEYEKNKSLYAGRLVIPYCTVGGRSGAYAKQLVGKGVKVKNYQGSILKWIDAGLPLVTLEGKPTHRVHTYSDRYRVPEKYEQVTK